MKEIVSVSLGPSHDDYELVGEALGHDVRVRRYGADGSFERAEALVRRYASECDAIGLGMADDHFTVGRRRFVTKETEKILEGVRHVPVTTGARLRPILAEWTVRHVQHALGHYFDNARVLFLSGMADDRLARVLAEHTSNLVFADAILDLGLPHRLESLEALETYARAHVKIPKPLAARVHAIAEPAARLVLDEALASCSMIAGPYHTLEKIGLERLRDKVVITSAVGEDRLAALRDARVEAVVDQSVQPFSRVVGVNVLEALFLAVLGEREHDVLDDDLLALLSDTGLAPRVLYPDGVPRRTNRFAFVIHPLSQEYFKRVKPVEVLSKVAPPVVMDALEKGLAHAPPFVYSHVTGIESPMGTRSEGWLISVGGTPKELLAHDPEFTYRRLLAAAEMAKHLGAQLMGLGAFTKVVGDAGVTVARRAALPITTGNSYSASAALWALADAVRRMGLIPLDVNGRIQGKAMVVGATGSIGAVCARLLAQAADEVTLVSKEPAKLLALKEQILEDTPDAKLHVATSPDDYLPAMDAIVTATSGAGKKVLDITKVKPGCVITDVARPLDLSPEDVRKRPDVLVIESGEILLPGHVSMKNIGLPESVAYACLAETIVLALEGRFENFTVGRNLEWAKVKEIYRMGLRHGMRLAAISGVDGPFSDEDIRRVRDRALAAREHAASA